MLGDKHGHLSITLLLVSVNHFNLNSDLSLKRVMNIALVIFILRVIMSMSDLDMIEV